MRKLYLFCNPRASRRQFWFGYALSDDGKVFAAQTIEYYHNIESELCDDPATRDRIRSHFGDDGYQAVIVPSRCVAKHSGIQQALESIAGP